MARPTKTPKPGTQQVTVSLRVPVELKTALEARAAANHRNLSQEAERTLERSFSPEALFVDVVGLMAEMEVNAQDRFTVAAGYVRTLANSVFGERVGEVGFRLMKAMAMERMLTSNGMPHAARAALAEDIEFFLETIRELQGNTDRADQQAPTGPAKDDASDVAPSAAAHPRSAHQTTKTTSHGSRSHDMRPGADHAYKLLQQYEAKARAPRSSTTGEFKLKKARMARKKVPKPSQRYS